ncbi:ATP-grasp domain-containing protein [Streptomyces sp. NPDC058872]|uniref:ATP-grasp domain-containing protein n=1 Tax=Streptomyces sp. NPDC058872 TaxID=3346661 RepID=UPI003691CF1D
MTRSPSDGPVVIVDPFSSGGMYAAAFKDAGVPVVAVLSGPDMPEVYRASFHPEDFPELIVFDGDLDAVVSRLRRLSPRCVLPGAESGVELADLLAEQITEDLANVPELREARRHKGEMAEAARRAGLPVIRQICTDDAAEVAAWIEREGLTGRDLVVKPPKSASTDGVTRVRDDWREAFEAQLGRHNQWQIVNDRMVVQEFVTGHEYVVDVFSHDGVHTVTDLCRYSKIDNGTHMAVYDAMEWVAPDAPEVAGLVDYTRRFLDSVGFRFGAAHVEVMLTEDGPRLIELNARPHGGGQPRFCRAATGDSQIDRAVRYVTGGELPEHYELLNPTLVVFLISRAAGIVRNAACLQEIGKLATHYAHVIGIEDGDRLEVTKDLLNTLSLGFAVLSGPDRKQIWADYEEVRRIEAGLIVTEEPTP